MRRYPLLALAAAMILFAAGCSSSSPHPGGRSGSPTGSGRAAPSAAVHFLQKYVTADGRVIRHDQGGDIVSEGQAYGMLIAEIAGRADVVRRIWTWTSAHLARGDGLLSSRASGSGHIENAQPASDADVLAAYALLRYRGADASALQQAGKRLAAEVLAKESSTAGGQVVIMAGPWALTTKPPTVDPSYLMPGVFAALAKYTGDARWQTAATTAVTLVSGLTGNGKTLPTDWASLSGGRLSPAANPGGGSPVQYGLDAQRVPLWFATACTDQARSLAGRWWNDVLSHHDRVANLALTPDGGRVQGGHHPLPLLAGAAAARAAGDRHAADSLLGRARQQAASAPTYYGNAWLALGSALLDGTLDPCHDAQAG
jgi:endoglucanase